MQFTTDQKHAATLDFLSQVRDYIASWPAHPMNRQMLKQINEHLEDPTHKLIAEHGYTRSGANFTPAGVCVIEATVQLDELTVRVPPDAIPGEQIIRRLRAGEVIRLKPDESF